MVSIGIPIFSVSVCYFTHMMWVDQLGEFASGLLQIYFGYTILEENTKILVGQSVEKQEREDLIKIIKSLNEIEDVERLKTYHLDQDKIKISVSAKYNAKEIADNIEDVLVKEIQQIAKSKAQEIAIRQLVRQTAIIAITHFTEINLAIEDHIKKQFGNRVFDIDIEMSKLNIHDKYRGIVTITESESDGEPLDLIDVHNVQMKANKEQSEQKQVENTERVQKDKN